MSNGAEKRITSYKASTRMRIEISLGSVEQFSACSAEAVCGGEFVAAALATVGEEGGEGDILLGPLAERISHKEETPSWVVVQGDRNGADQAEDGEEEVCGGQGEVEQTEENAVDAVDGKKPAESHGTEPSPGVELRKSEEGNKQQDAGNEIIQTVYMVDPVEAHGVSVSAEQSCKVKNGEESGSGCYNAMKPHRCGF